MTNFLKNPAKALEEVKSHVPESIQNDIGELKSHLPDSLQNELDGAINTVTGALDSIEALNPEAIVNKVSEFINHPIRATWPVLRPSLIPFFFSTIGSLVAGVILNWALKWDVFDAIPQLTIMLFPFMGMVTNVMSTLSSRLKQLDDEQTDLKHFLLGNLKVVQCQAILTSVFASATSILASTCKASTRSKINLKSSLVLSSASLVTSVITNTVLTTLLGVMIFISRKFQFKMDTNAIFTTVSSFRDIVSISLIALITSSLEEVNNQIVHIALLSPIAITPVLMFFARRNPHTKSVIFHGLPSLFGAVLLEQPGGVVVHSVFKQHPVASALQPMVNGIARNLVGIHYHLMHFLKEEIEKVKMPDFLSNFIIPLVENFINSKISHLLMQILIPAHLVALGLIMLGQLQFSYTLVVTLPFVVSYLVAILIQLFVLLHVSHGAIFASRKYGFDPDHTAMPTITSITNLLGTCAMAAVFAILSAVNDPNGHVASDMARNGTSNAKALFESIF